MISFKYIQSNTARGGKVISTIEHSTARYRTRIIMQGREYARFYWDTFNEMTRNHHKIANTLREFERRIDGYKEIYHERSFDD